MCPDLKVHGTQMEKVSEDTYLGDIISHDGRNSKNIKSRIAKGVGITSQIMTLLETVTLGKHCFTSSILRRESKFVKSNSDQL